LNIAFKISIPLIEKPAEKYVNDVKIAKAAVVLISFVGAASSPEGISINFKELGSSQFEPNTKRKIVVINGKIERSKMDPFE
jgi:archaellum component FlaF (FlaF/FlaG flagellin family)